MEIHVHPQDILIPYLGSFKIVAFGDVHFGASACHIKRFEKMVLRANADNPHAYFICMGDALDLIGPKDPRFRPQEASPYEDFVDHQIEGFVKLFKKYDIPEHRIIGFGLGNHEDSIRKFYGTDPVNRISAMLKTKNLGYMWAVKLPVRIINGEGELTRRQFSVKIMGHHGFAGGRKEGGAVNAYMDWVHRHPGQDVYLFGHNHKKWFHKVPIVEIDYTKKEQLDRSVLIGNTGTYLKTYSKGSLPTYSEKKGYYPVEIGHVEINVKHVSEEQGDSRKPGKRRQREWLDIRGTE